MVVAIFPHFRVLLLLCFLILHLLLRFQTRHGKLHCAKQKTRTVSCCPNIFPRVMTDTICAGGRVLLLHVPHMPFFVPGHWHSRSHSVLLFRSSYLWRA